MGSWVPAFRLSANMNSRGILTCPRVKKGITNIGSFNMLNINVTESFAKAYSDLQIAYCG